MIPARGAVRQETGMALVAALFLIVVLAGIGLYAMRIGGAQQTDANATLLSVRAEAAALTGLEYASNQALRHSRCPAPSLAFGAGGLGGFSIAVSCAGTKIPGTMYFVYKITSTATYGAYGTAGYAARSTTREVTNAP